MIVIRSSPLRPERRRGRFYVQRCSSSRARSLLVEEGRLSLSTWRDDADELAYTPRAKGLAFHTIAERLG